MGSSFLSLREPIPEKLRQSPYDEFGFWVEETAMVGWFRSVAVIIRERSNAPEWLSQLCEQWETFDENTGGGCVFDLSSDYLTTPDRKTLMLELTTTTLQRLLDHGGDVYTAFPHTQPKQHCPDCPAPRPLDLSEKAGTIEVGLCYARLLRGMSGSFWPAGTIGFLPTAIRTEQP